MSNDGRFGDPIRLGAMKPSTAILLLESLSIGSARMLFSSNRGTSASEEIMRLYDEVASVLGIDRQTALLIADRSSPIVEVLQRLEGGYAGEVEVRLVPDESSVFRSSKGSLVIDISGERHALLPLEVTREQETAFAKLEWRQQREQREVALAEAFDQKLLAIMPLLASAAGLEVEFFVETTVTAKLRADVRSIGFEAAREAVEKHLVDEFTHRSARCSVRRFISTDLNENGYSFTARAVVPLESINKVQDVEITVERQLVPTPRL